MRTTTRISSRKTKETSRGSVERRFLFFVKVANWSLLVCLNCAVLLRSRKRRIRLSVGLCLRRVTLPSAAKSPKRRPRRSPLGNPPSKKICTNSIFGTCSLKWRILCHAAAPAAKHSKTAFSLECLVFVWFAVCFCTSGVCLNRQDNHRAGRENPKRDKRPSLCRLWEEGFLKGRRGIETPSPLLRPLGTLGRAKVPRRRQNTVANS